MSKEEAKALLEKEAGLLRAMELRKELSAIAESFVDPKLEYVVMQLKCACSSIVMARNTFDELVGFVNYTKEV